MTPLDCISEGKNLCRIGKSQYLEERPEVDYVGDAASSVSLKPISICSHLCQPCARTFSLWLE